MESAAPYVRECTVKRADRCQNGDPSYQFVTIMHAHQTSKAADFRFQNTINPNVTQSVSYWADEFDVPPAKLLEVLREVGRNVYEVRKRLST